MKENNMKITMRNIEEKDTLKMLESIIDNINMFCFTTNTSSLDNIDDCLLKKAFISAFKKKNHGKTEGQAPLMSEVIDMMHKHIIREKRQGGTFENEEALLECFFVKVNETNKESIELRLEFEQCECSTKIWYESINEEIKNCEKKLHDWKIPNWEGIEVHYDGTPEESIHYELLYASGAWRLTFVGKSHKKANTYIKLTPSKTF